MSRTSWMPRAAIGVFAIALAIGTTAADARDLRIGYAGAPTSIDPHADVGSANITFNLNTYEALTGLNEKGELSPVLAESWTPSEDGLSWTFKLRQGVKFQDGTDFTAEDVVASIKRALSLEAPNPFGGYIRSIGDAKAIDDHTVVLATTKPDPILPESLGLIAIMTKESAEAATTEALNSMKFTKNSTAAYQLVEYVPGERVVHAASPTYWGTKPIFDNVIETVIPDPSTRVASILAGDVDLIEDVPTVDIQRLQQNNQLSVTNLPSTRAPYITLDQYRETSPDITDKNGKPIKNPFLDWRVRKAVSLAIDRDAIVEKIMQGNAVKTMTVVPEGGVGYSPELNSAVFFEYDPEAASKLLAEAGYPEGFRVVFHFNDGTHVNAKQHGQAIAQMLARIGIDVEVRVLPFNLYIPNWRSGAYSMAMLSYSGNNLEPARSIHVIVHSKVEDSDVGVHNSGRYVNKAADFYFERSLTEMDRQKREAYYRLAHEAIAHEVNVIFTHFATKTWATSKGLIFTPYLTEDSTRIAGVRLE